MDEAANSGPSIEPAGKDVVHVVESTEKSQSMGNVTVYLENRRGELMEFCHANSVDVAHGKTVRFQGKFGGTPETLSMLREGDFVTAHFVNKQRRGREYEMEVLRVTIVVPPGGGAGDFDVLMANRSLK